MIKKILFIMGAFSLSTSLHAMNPEQFLREYPVTFTLGQIDNQTDHMLDIFYNDNALLAKVEPGRSIELFMDNVFGQFAWIQGGQVLLSDPIQFILNDTGETFQLFVRILLPYQGNVELEAILFEGNVGPLLEMVKKTIHISLNEFSGSRFVVDVLFDIDEEMEIDRTKVFISKD